MHIHSSLSADEDMGEHPCSRNSAHIEPSVFILFITSRLHKNLNSSIGQISERYAELSAAGFQGLVGFGQLAQALVEGC